MRIVAGCLLLVAAALAPQQSSSEYHGIYGPSDVERFTVRPGISMTVEYGPDQVACQMIITRSRPLLATIHWPPTSTMLSENEMNQIIDELAPTAVRGAKIQNLGGWQSGQAFASGEDYENAAVLHTGIDCKKSPAAACTWPRFDLNEKNATQSTKRVAISGWPANSQRQSLVDESLRPGAVRTAKLNSIETSR